MKDEITNYLKSIDMPTPKEGQNNLKYCSLCETVYETWFHYGYGTQETKHYDMPTYGIDRKECQSCSVSMTYEMV